MTTMQTFLRHLVRALLLLSACIGTASAAAQPASDASVEKLVAINGAQKSLEQALAGMEAQIRQQVLTDMVRYNAGKPLATQQRVAIDQAVPQVAQVLRDKLSWESLKPAYIRIYKSQLSQPEVNRLIKLYQDPEYLSIVEKMQLVNQQSARLMFEQMPGIMKTLQPVLENAVQKALEQ